MIKRMVSTDNMYMLGDSMIEYLTRTCEARLLKKSIQFLMSLDFLKLLNFKRLSLSEDMMKPYPTIDEIYYQRSPGPSMETGFAYRKTLTQRSH